MQEGRDTDEMTRHFVQQQQAHPSDDFQQVLSSYFHLLPGNNTSEKISLDIITTVEDTGKSPSPKQKKEKRTN